MTTALRNAVRDGRVGHAYLFSGPAGHRQDHDRPHPRQGAQLPEPRRRRRPVRRVRELRRDRRGHASLDLFELDAASNSGVDDIRDLLERVASTSAPAAAKKVYILDEVHMLSDRRRTRC